MSEELRTTMPGWLKWLVTGICLAVVLAVLWQLAPRSAFPSDLALTGQGRPALVMVRDVGIMGGEQVMERMEAIYPEYEQRMDFLVVQTGHPDGLAFADQHEAGDGTVVLLDGQGEALATMSRPSSEEELIRFIDNGLR
ncbi:MAG: hypothetical protein WEB57_08560 [Pseudohongiellaceae bacterium]